MLKIRAIKFATSVNIGHSEEMFISERKPVDIYFDPAHERYLLVDQKTKRQVWVHTTNVQWCEPVECETIVPCGTNFSVPDETQTIAAPFRTELQAEWIPEEPTPEEPPPLIEPTPPPPPPEINAPLEHDHYSHKGAGPKGSRRAGPQKGHSKTHLR